MATCGHIHPRGEDEGVEPQWCVPAGLRRNAVCSSCLQPPLCGEETMNSPRISKGSKCSGCLSVIRPLWAELAEGRPPAPGGDEEDPCQPRVGWQKKAGTALEQHHHDNVVWPRLREHEQAVLRSQRGSLASTSVHKFPL